MTVEVPQNNKISKGAKTAGEKKLILLSAKKEIRTRRLRKKKEKFVREMLSPTKSD